MRTEVIGDATLILADCLAVLPGLSGVDAVVTDPPWELSETVAEYDWNGGVAPRSQRSHSLRKGTVGTFSAELIRAAQSVCNGDCFFLAGYKEVADVIKSVEGYRGLFMWHKPNSAPAVFYPAKLDTSFIVWAARKSALYGHQHWPSMIFRFAMAQAGCMATERILDNTGKAAHPCQGPVALYLSLVKPLGKTILDPFMGSGTTGVACLRTGRKFIGIEKEPTYFDIACKRIRAEYDRSALFVNVTPEPATADLYDELR